jgi:hypothetical protein
MFAKIMNQLDFQYFLQEQKRCAASFAVSSALVKAYMKKTPKVLPLWDITTKAIEFNDISSEILQSGIDIFISSYKALWNGIFKPSVYAPKTLWKNIHDRNKIAKIIDAWNNGNKLSPIFLVKHGAIPKALVADGKHRLTVAGYMKCSEIPFMVPKSTSSWVFEAIPSARKVDSVCPEEI